MDRKKIEEFLEEYYANTCDSAYRNTDALDNLTSLFEELIDFCENVEEFCKDTGKRLTRIENVIATPRWLSEIEEKQDERIEELKDEIELKRRHIENLCEMIGNATIKAREVTNKADELYYSILNGSLSGRDEKDN